MASSKSYYLEINGKPSCVSNLHPKSSPSWSCSQGTDRDTAEAERLLVLRDHPDADVVIREGFCPASAELWAAMRERDDAEEEYVRRRLEDPD